MALNFRKMPTGGKRKKGDRVMKETLPINLQFFAEGGDGNSDQNAGENNNVNTDVQGGSHNTQQSAVVDYDKIQTMLDAATQKRKMLCLKVIFSSKDYQKMK